MRVAIEAASLTLSSGGLARYTAELSLALARRYGEDEYTLVSDQPFVLPEGAPPNLRCGGGPRSPLERRWWLWGLNRELNRLGAEVIHGPDFAVPYRAARPSVMTLHDLSPWMDKGWHSAAGRVRRRTPILLRLGAATMVIVPGEAVRQAAIERFSLDAGRVVAVPEAAASWFRPMPVDRLAEPYFLFVGTIEPRKNLEVLIEAWRKVRAGRRVRLLIAGRRRADAPELPCEPGIELLGEVEDARLAGLYSGAVAVVYPSLYEGFGLPVLEAMQSGACVIASKAVREAAGDAAVYAASVEEFAAAMIRAASDPGWLAERRAAGLARARAFSWERAAELTHAVYEEARRRFGSQH
jgi:glycosyltransferase involved in cell wall biosynthesis